MFAELIDKIVVYEAEGVGRARTQKVDIYFNYVGQALVTSMVKEEKWVAPPKLYDLTTLQRDAKRLSGFTAKQTFRCRIVWCGKYYSKRRKKVVFDLFDISERC